MSLRRVLAVGLVAVAVAGVLGAEAQAAPGQATKSVVITVRLVQEATYQHPHPPPIGLVLSTTLKLYAVGTVLGLPNNTYLGTMSFTYQLHGTCSAGGDGCTGTTNLQTMTTFPGGTISAGGASISLSAGLVVPIEKGTGAFKGASGSIDIAPGGQASSIYHLTLPASA
jgi:hypothetical protein